MKIASKVRCIINKGKEEKLVIGNEYVVLDVRNDKYLIYAEKGEILEVSNFRFEVTQSYPIYENEPLPFEPLPFSDELCDKTYQYQMLILYEIALDALETEMREGLNPLKAMRLLSLVKSLKKESEY